MDTHELRLGLAKILEPDLAEIIVNKDITLDSAMVNEYHEWIKKNLPDPCYILINKRNLFEYTFNAQIEIGSIRQIKAAAFFTPRETTYQVTEMLAKIPRKLEWNYRIFYSYYNALSWLKKQRRSLVIG